MEPGRELDGQGAGSVLKRSPRLPKPTVPEGHGAHLCGHSGCCAPALTPHFPSHHSRPGGSLMPCWGPAPARELGHPVPEAPFLVTAPLVLPEQPPPPHSASLTTAYWTGPATPPVGLGSLLDTKPHLLNWTSHPRNRRPPSL